jgi:hypothetical protein
MKIIYDILKPEDFPKNYKFIKIVENENGHDVYNKFHYFKPDHIYSYNESGGRIFFVAYKNTKNCHNIIGVLKTAVYKYYEQKPFRAINYVDVSIDYRRNGIAKNLIKMVNDYVLNEKSIDTLVSSYITEEGEKCGMRKLLIENITINNFRIND